MSPINPIPPASPTDVTQVNVHLLNIYEKLENIEKSVSEVQQNHSSLQNKVVTALVAIVITIAAKYGIDLSGIIN